MTGIWNRTDRLERQLRAGRPEPSSDLVAALAARVSSRPYRRSSKLRFGFAGALSFAMLASLSAFGGIGYAASAASSVAHTAAAVVSSARHESGPKGGQSSQSGGSSSASGQYGSKVTMCHNGNEITIGQSGEPAHLAQGDTEGPCPASSTPGHGH
jgi:hypothetical protein